MRGLRILVVEDNPADARLVEELLKENGTWVDLQRAVRLSEARDKIGEGPDCVLLDLGLPDSEGLDGLSTLRQDAPVVPIVVITGRNDEQLAVEALHLGAEDYLVKGKFDGASLYRSIRFAVERNRLRNGTVDIPRPIPSGSQVIDIMVPVIQACPLAIVALDLDANVILWNPSAESTFGWRADEVLGRPLPTMPDDEQGERFRQFFMSALAGSGPVEYEAVRLRKDGVLIQIQAVVVALRDAVGEPIGTVAFGTDITARREAEEMVASTGARWATQAQQLNEADQQLHEVQNRYSSLFEANVIGIICGKEALFEEANDAFLDMIGYSQAELEGGLIEWPELTPPEWSHVDEAAVEEMLRTGRTGPWEKEYIHKSGNRVPVIIGGAALSSDPFRWIAFVEDQSERKRAEAALKETAAAMERRANDLELANAELDQFSHLVAHDLAEPLQTISSYISLLARRYGNHLDEGAEELIDATVDGARRMQELLDDVMTYSRARTGMLSVALVDCSAVISETLAVLQSLLREAQAEVSVEQLPVVWANPTGLGQVFQNLLSNAVKFRSRERTCRVRVWAEREEEAWSFSVADNGIGIDEPDQRRIFDLFGRLHGREEYPGTGAGLAICKKIIERHHGDLTVHSTPGQGSTFTFTLPHQPAG